MNKAARESGYARWSKLAFLVVAGAAVYATAAFGPAVLSYYRIKQDARRLAYRTLDPGVNEETQITYFLADVYERERLSISRHEVGYRRQDNQVNVSVRLSLPIKAPGFDEGYRWETLVEVAAIRSRGF